MRILALTSNYRLSGQGLAAHYICEALAKRGHDIRLQVFDSTQELKARFKRLSYKVDVRPSVPLMLSTGIHVLKQVLYLLNLQRAKAFDLALGLDANDAAAMGAAFAKEAGLPVAIVGWGNEVKGLGRGELGFLRNCDLLLPMSRWAKEMFVEAEFDEERMKVMVPGVDPEIFRPASRERKGLGILTVTDLVKGCGVGQLIKVLRLLLDRGNDSWLTAVGEGKELGRLKARARKVLLENSIEFVTPMHPRKLAELMRGHHVMALIPRTIRGRPPRDFSLTMIEAAATGLGVVGTESGGLADSLRFSGGLKVPAEGTERIAKAIEKAALKASMDDDPDGVDGRVQTWEETALDMEMTLEDLVYE
jgi:glycosyltransferase involved in cell wall biosynthesis